MVNPPLGLSHIGFGNVRDVGTIPKDINGEQDSLYQAGWVAITDFE